MFFFSLLPPNAVLRQDGTDSDDTTKSVAVGGDGSIYLAGYTEGDWNQQNAGETDFAVTKLSPDGSLLWRWQVLPAERKEIYHTTTRRPRSCCLHRRPVLFFDTAFGHKHQWKTSSYNAERGPSHVFLWEKVHVHIHRIYF